MIGAKCKKCRTYGQKLLLNERCTSNKCGFSRRRTRPGVHGRSRRSLSEYARQLIEKQKVKFSYLLRERQLRRAFKTAQRQGGSVRDTLAKMLETRLDQVVFRLGYTSSKTTARQLVTHGHFLVNGRQVKISSYHVQPGDVIALKESSKGRAPFKDLELRLRRYQPPSWLQINRETFEGEMVRTPELEEVGLPFDFNLVIDFYSRHG